MRDDLQEALLDEPSFREVADALSLGVPFRIHLDVDGRTARFVHLGSACHAVLGISPDALLADAQAFGALMAPEDRARLSADKASLVAGRDLWTAEIRFRKPSGELRWLRLTSANRPAPDGGLLLDGLIIDITESRQLAEQLAEERRRLEQTIELTGIGVFQWDRDAPETVVWSDDQYAIYGVPRQTPITVAAFADMVHPEDRQLWCAAAARTFDACRDATLEHRIVRRDGEVRWVSLHQRIRSDAQGLKSVHGTTLDVTESRDAEERRRLQMRELAHRSKNAMTILMAMVKQAARGAKTVEALTDLILSRLGAMARSQNLATASEGAPVRLTQLLAQVLEPFDLSRFDIDPKLESTTIVGDNVVLLALLLHELATNAVKYGALSNADGRVGFSLRVRGEGWVAVQWREHGGPSVKPPARRGFGSRLLATALRGQGGAVTPAFMADGFIADIQLPLS